MTNILKPRQSFKHTLQEISVNRDSPCELIRELVSNSYDAGANNIRIFPLVTRKGLIFFDDGVGLSDKENNEGVSAYVSFFSIGLSTKIKGGQIGYKCQGSKLCFASGRFALITRCPNEDQWRYIVIENPKSVLNEDFNITPQLTYSPDKELKKFLSQNPLDNNINTMIETMNEDFFLESFKQGTMLVLENFEVTDYQKYFGVSNSKESYLYNYIRFHTAHGDTRVISESQGFSRTDINAVNTVLNAKTPPYTPSLKLWLSDSNRLDDIPRGLPYLEISEKEKSSPPLSPVEVSQLRKGSFYSRHATSFKLGGQAYTLIFAIDGRRRSLDNYPELGRRGNSGCGMTLSSQRGVFLSSHGVRICPYNEILKDSRLSEMGESLYAATDHFVFFIDGEFELITNRNQLTDKSKNLLIDGDFVEKIRLFLADMWNDKKSVFRELVQRVNKDYSSYKENDIIKRHDDRKASIIDGTRTLFHVNNIEFLKNKWFATPIVGEEHFVGALYTLFSNLIKQDHPLVDFWKRPLTFAAVGIDSIAVDNQQDDFSDKNLFLLEYKYDFSPDDEFNHPFSITNQIICWKYSDVSVGAKVQDGCKHIATVKSLILSEGIEIGFELGDICRLSTVKDLGHTIRVLSLEKLLRTSFDITWKEMMPNVHEKTVTKPKRSRRAK